MSIPATTVAETPIGKVKVAQYQLWLDFLESYYVKTYRTIEDVANDIKEKRPKEPYVVWPDVTDVSKFYACFVNQSLSEWKIEGKSTHILFDPVSAEIMVESDDKTWNKIDNVKLLRSQIQPKESFQRGGRQRRRSRKVKKARPPQ